MKTDNKQPKLNSPDIEIKHKAFIFALKIFISVLLTGGIVAGVWGVARSYEGKIYPRVTVAGLKIGGLTPTDAKQVIDAYVTKINSEGPTIVYNNNDEFTPMLSELGVVFNTQKIIDEAYNFGRNDSILERIKENATLIAKAYDIPLTPSIDEEKLDAYLGQMATVLEVAPIDATLKYQNSEWTLQASAQGLGLNKNRLKNSISNLIQTGQNQGEIVLETTVLEPAVKEAGAMEAKPEADKFLAAAPIQIEFKDESLMFTASRAEIASWIDFVTSGTKLKPGISDKKLGGYVGWIASKIEIEKIDKEIVDGTGEVQNAGQDGRGIDKDKLTAEIKTRVQAGSSGSPIAVSVFIIPKGQVTIYPSAQPGRYTGRYIDINLSEQTLYAFEGTKQVNSFLVSTGRSGYATPTGEFHIYGKDRYALMDGPDYYLPNVPFVSWFLGDYSIHGTYWHSNFGHVMSHGCVNASISDAEWVFNWAEVGTAVYIHY